MRLQYRACLCKWLFFCCFFTFNWQPGHAQQLPGLKPKHPLPYYYFGSQKIYLQQSKSTIYLQTNLPGRVKALASALQSKLRSTKAGFRALATASRGLITLQNPADIDSTLAWMKQQPGVLVARPAVFQKENHEQVYEERFYVKLKPATTLLMLQTQVAKAGCSLAGNYKYDAGVYLVNAGKNAGYDALTTANQFFETGLFEFSEPDFRPLNLLHNPPPPNDYLFPIQWALKNTGIQEQFNGVAGADIGIEDAWLVTKGNPNIRIAVIDEGVERTHPDLKNNIDPLGFGLAANNATTGAPLASKRSHGTSCAGIIAAQANNSVGIAGVAPLCKIIPVNLTIDTAGNFGSNEQIASCIDWAWKDGKADILSDSWGGGTPSSLINDAIKRAVTLGRGGKGATVFFSAGNDDAGLADPSVYPLTIAVGAMDMCYQRKSINTCDAENFWGSNYGSGLDIAAPGVKIATTAAGGVYNPAFNGTSSACPFAAGVAALMLSVDSTLSQVQLREIMERSTRKVGNYVYSRVPGQPNGTWSPELGYGMLSAKLAVNAVKTFDYACKVQIAAEGPTRFCSGGSVKLSVLDPAGAAIYYWLRNGAQVALGNNYTAATPGLYQARIVRPGGCQDTSIAIEVQVPVSAGALQARAGTDTSICFNAIHFLGGGPAAVGGTPLLHPMRAMANEMITKQFLRFDPRYPANMYRTVNADFNQYNPSARYKGAAVTPHGLFMITDNDQLFKVDTATGQTYLIGSLGLEPGYFWSDLTYNNALQKMYAIATATDLSFNQLYEINYRSGSALSLGIIGGSNSKWLASVAANARGDMYLMSNTLAGSSQIYRLQLSPLSITPLSSSTGFQAWFDQGADFDPVTGQLFVSATTRPVDNGKNFPGCGLWKADTATGTAKLVGSIAEPFNRINALSFAGPEYNYSWSPATYLSNPKDANPMFAGAPPGKYTYTLTVTDLCGQTAQSTVTITVKRVLKPNADGVLYVNAAATATGNGSSWANAVTSLQDALQFSCNDVKQIWVAKGIYKPTTDNNRDSAFTLRNNLYIFGGFAGTETHAYEAQPAKNITILSGDIGVANSFADNSYNVIRNNNNGLNNTALLLGFTITGGNANKGTYFGNRGGGILNYLSSPIIASCIITGNNAVQYGGGIFEQGSSSFLLNNVIAGNTAQYGGGLYNESATPDIVNCTFSGNLVAVTGGGIYTYGAVSPKITNSIVWGNSSGVQNAGGATPVIKTSIVQANPNSTAQDSIFLVKPVPGLGNTGNLQLRACSPAINAGINEVIVVYINRDIAGNPRLSQTNVDLGAYERQIGGEGVVYVDSAAKGNNNGSSWADALNSLQDALTYNCAEVTQIWVAKGTYYATNGTSRDAAFTLRNNLAVYGGFAGNETQLSQRKWWLNTTILSGDIGAKNNITDNSYNVIRNNNNALNSTAVLDGFTITGGNADNPSDYFKSRGGGMHNYLCSPAVNNCIFRGNNTAAYGGGMFNQGGVAKLLNTVFAGNTALYGGGLYNESAATELTNCTFAGNAVTVTGAAMYTYGAVSPKVTNTIMWGNGSGIQNAGGATPVISKSIIQGASAYLPQDSVFMQKPVPGLGNMGDLRLRPCSPAINAGDNTALPANSTLDVAGNARVAFNQADIGAYEKQTTAADTVYVDITATGNNDGSSWANAYTNINDAFNDASLCENSNKLGTILIARGSYKLNSNPTVLRRLNGVVSGGWPNGGGTLNVAANPVVIVGNISVLRSMEISGVRVADK